MLPSDWELDLSSKPPTEGLAGFPQILCQGAADSLGLVGDSAARESPAVSLENQVAEFTEAAGTTGFIEATSFCELAAEGASLSSRPADEANFGSSATAER